MKVTSQQDLAVNDAIIQPQTKSEEVAVAEVLCDSREMFAVLYESITGTGYDYHLENAQTIVNAARKYVDYVHSLVSENVGENL